MTKQDIEHVVIDVERLEMSISRIFAAAGCGAHEADEVSKRLVASSCAGHHSHGLVRVLRYLDWMDQGHLVPNQKPVVELDAGAIVVVDGNRGFGQMIAPFAVDIGISKAQLMGVSVVGLKRSGHLGRLGDWSERAALAGLIAIHFANVNGHLLVAPFGGIDRRFSTAPFTIAIPREGTTPVILDFATSLVAEGKVMVAAKGGEAVPDRAMIDTDGNSSGDPETLYGKTPPGEQPHPRNGSGALRAFGGHKGSGLAFMCEVLGGLLTGSGTTGDAKAQDHLWSGMCGIYIDPRRFETDGTFRQSFDTFIDFVHQTRSQDKTGRVFVPGEREELAICTARADGLALPISIWKDLQSAAERFDLEL